MSRTVNHVTLLGHLGRDPEIKHTKGGTPVARISLATNNRFKDKSGEWQDRAEWHVVILWARLAEIAGEFIKKGSKVYIEGRLQTRSWEDTSASPTTRYATEVIGEQLIMLDDKSKAPAAGTSTENTGPITDEDIPF